MSKPVVTWTSDQSATVEMPNTSGQAETYSVFWPEPGCPDPWVKVCRGGGKWALLNSRTHQRQIQNVLCVVDSARA